MNVLTCGSLFSGAGLLDIGLHLAGFEHRWMCEPDPYRRELLRARFGVPVYDDIRTLRGQAATDTDNGLQRGPDYEAETPRPDQEGAGGAIRIRQDVGGVPAVAPVDLIAGGFPCKGASSAGNRAGFEHPETALWFEMRRVIREVRPRYVLIENVGDILGMAAAAGEPPGSLWGAVLGDLATLGFDVRWDCLPAAAVGAPHLRDRVFAVATQSTRADEQRDGGQRRIGDGAAADANGARGEGHGRPERVRAQVAGTDGIHDREGWRGTLEPDERSAGADDQGRSVGVDWGEYRPAIRRWEAIYGPAPEPRVRRVDARVPDMQRVRARVDRSRLSALGDGVHVYVAYIVGLAIIRHAATGSWEG